MKQNSEITDADADRTTDASASRRRGIQSVEIGLNVLRAVAAQGGSSPLGTISQTVGMSPPQVHRYLQSLIATGMASQDRATGRYDLGPAALQLGLAALARTDAFKLVDRFVSEFVTRTGETVMVTALGPIGPTVVRWYAGSPAVTTSLTVGSVLSLLQSATGRVFLCFTADVATSALVKRESRKLPIKKSDIAELLADVRKTGRASVSGSLIPGLDATAFPIFNLQGNAILVATLLWPEVLRDQDRTAVSDELATICRTISTQLGWTSSQVFGVEQVT